jgi:mono/diheme cytochrome c family protein
MRNCWLSAVVFVLFAGIRPGMAYAQLPPPLKDIASEVRVVFAAKCAACHGSDLAKPRGRFGYVLDLRRVAANPEMIVPHHPEESELWELVQRGEMPPSDSSHGPLTPAQKEVIRVWIAAGAPDVSPGGLESSTSVNPEPTVPLPTELISVDRILSWLGKFHLLFLHFPISLIVVAGIGEGWSMWRRNPIPSEAVRFCLWLGALAAIPTAVLGWVFAANGNGISSLQLLTAHRWLGTTAAIWLVITALYAEGDTRLGRRSLRVRLLLIGGVVIIALTAHLGGLLARGEDFFAYEMSACL